MCICPYIFIYTWIFVAILPFLMWHATIYPTIRSGQVSECSELMPICFQIVSATPVFIKLSRGQFFSVDYLN